MATTGRQSPCEYSLFITVLPVCLIRCHATSRIWLTVSFLDSPEKLRLTRSKSKNREGKHRSRSAKVKSAAKHSDRDRPSPAAAAASSSRRSPSLRASPRLSPPPPQIRRITPVASTSRLSRPPSHYFHCIHLTTFPRPSPSPSPSFTKSLQQRWRPRHYSSSTSHSLFSSRAQAFPRPQG